jgi:chromate transporter
VARATTGGTSSEVFREFLRMGLIGFGGPSAHLALFRQRFVRDLRWIDERAFLDAMGAANLLPGPTSTEVALAIGQARAGRLGLLAAGLGFIGPAAFMVLVLAIAYERFGTLAAVGWLLYGIQPVVVAIVGLAVAGLAPTALRGPVTWLIGGAATAALLVGVDPVAVLLVAAISGLLIAVGRGWRPGSGGGALGIAMGAVPGKVAGAVGIGGIGGISGIGLGSIGLPALFLLFLKIGLLSFGSGYVLVAFLRTDLVQGLGLLSDRQLLDAVAVGQVTPGPVYTAATFVGYLLAGVPGAVVATIAIFLPAFIGVALVHPFVPRLRGSLVASAVLDGVNAASLGLMAAVTIQLARTTVVDAVTLALVVGSFLVLLRRPRAAVPLMVVGAAVGVLVHAGGLVR